MFNKISKAVEVIAMLALIVAVIQLMQSIWASQTQDNAQSTQLAAFQENSYMQLTQNAISGEQLSIQQEMLTVLAGDVGGGPNATAVAKQIEKLEGTAIALETLQHMIPSHTPLPYCSGTGNIPPVPGAPPSGCILIVEWWVKPKPTPCGLLITRDAPSIPSASVGTWYIIYPNRVDGHIKDFEARNIPCEIVDLR